MVPLFAVMLSQVPEARAEEPELPPSEASTTPAEPGESERQGEAVEHHGSIFFDPLGFLLFGPSVAGEVGFGNFAAQASFRLFSAGLLSKALFLTDEDTFAMSYGVALHGDYYFSPGLKGPFVGLAAEYLHSRVENDSAKIATISSYIVPQIEGGYRFGFERWFFGGTAALGYAARVSSEVENLPGGTNADLYTVSNESSPYGTVRLDIGVYF